MKGLTLFLMILLILFSIVVGVYAGDVAFGDVKFSATTSTELDSIEADTSDAIEIPVNFWAKGKQPSNITIQPTAVETNDSTNVIVKASYSMDGSVWTTPTALDTLLDSGTNGETITGLKSFTPEAARYLRFIVNGSMAGGDTVTVSIPYSITY